MIVCEICVDGPKRRAAVGWDTPEWISTGIFDNFLKLPSERAAMEFRHSYRVPSPQLEIQNSPIFSTCG